MWTVFHFVSDMQMIDFLRSSCVYKNSRLNELLLIWKTIYSEFEPRPMYSKAIVIGSQQESLVVGEEADRCQPMASG